MATIEGKTEPLIGASVPRIDAWDKVLGKAAYPGDLRLSGALHGKVVFSERAHARILDIDTSAARAYPGVVAVFTYVDVPCNEYGINVNDQHVLAYFGKPKPDGYANAIINHVHPGSIILMHDGFGTIHDVTKSDKSLAVEALPIIIAQLKAKGYRFVTVPEMLGVDAYNTAK